VHSKLIAGMFLVVVVAMLVVSFTQGIDEGLPSVALDWNFGLKLLRGLGAFGLVAIVAMILVRGWGGMWPQRITSGGVEFPELEQEVADDASEVSELVRAILTELTNYPVSGTPRRAD
jgi:hypothetical protein